MRESQGRHELKHYINYADVLQLRARLPYVTDIDENAADGCSYRVKSLYFDNYNDKVLNEKMNGVNEREKFHLRRYNDDTSFIRLEKKSKRNSLCYKESVVVSKLETGTMELYSQNYNLTKSIKETVIRLSELLKNDGYSIEFEHSEDVYVSADEAKITQAFYNLLTNAVNYSANDKHIIVRQIRMQKNVRIEVIDHGDGIAREDIPYIWDRYYKVDKKHKRAITGTGLGLSIVKKIFELHGADYGVDSEMGKGSVFWFQLETITNI